MKLDSILDIIRPLSVHGSRAVAIEGLAYDSRQVKPGSLFVAIPGVHQDGAVYITDACQRGAAVIILQAESPVKERAPATVQSAQPGITFVQVANARLALAQAACRFYQDPSRRLRVAGVTGTNGKTTVTFMLRDIFRVAGWSPGLIGTIRYEIGERQIPAARTTPEAPDIQSLLAGMIQAGCQSVAMEVSSHALDQDRSWGIDFDAAVFTNLTRDHLDYHRTMDNYFAAKARLFDQLSAGTKNGVAVINLDDPRGAALVSRLNKKTRFITFGSNPAAEARAEDVEIDPAGSRFTFRHSHQRVAVRLKLMGRFNVSNALAAMTCGLSMGIPLETMAQVLAGIDCIPGRLEPISNDRGLHILVDYAHTDDALANVLDTLREFKQGRLIVVFGCGGDRDRTKRPLMGAAAARRADFTILTSDNPRSEDPEKIVAEIAAAFAENPNFEKITDRRTAIQRGLALARAGDTLLIAGKGHETYQEAGQTIVPFDDREVVRELLKG